MFIDRSMSREYAFQTASEYEVLRCEPFTVNIVVDAEQFNTYSQPSSVSWPRGYETRRPREGSNRALCCDGNLRQGSFEALVTAADPGFTPVLCMWGPGAGDTGRVEGSQSWHDTDGEWVHGAGAGAATGGIKSEDYQARGHWTHYTGTR